MGPRLNEARRGARSAWGTLRGRKGEAGGERAPWLLWGSRGVRAAERFDPRPQTPWAAEPRGTHSRSQRGALSPSPGAPSWREKQGPWQAAASFPPVWALGGVAWRLDASRLPSPAGWGARPGCSQDPPSAEVCQGRELIKHDESGEREPVRCPPAAPAPAGPSPGARHTRGPPVPACAAAASWSVRAPLGAGDAWELGIGSAGDLPSHLGLRLA